MDWLNNIITDVQKHLQKDVGQTVRPQAMAAANDRKSNEKLHKFQVRLHDLDKRLLELR